MVSARSITLRGGGARFHLIKDAENGNTEFSSRRGTSGHSPSGAVSLSAVSAFSALDEVAVPFVVAGREHDEVSRSRRLWP